MGSWGRAVGSQVVEWGAARAVCTPTRPRAKLRETVYVAMRLPVNYVVKYQLTGHLYKIY